MMRRPLFLLASIAVSAIFLWLALRGVPVQDIVTRVREANVFWLGVGLLAVTAGLWTRAIRWRGLLGRRVTTIQAFHMLNIAMLLNQLPFRAGEVARSLLATRSQVPLMTAATSIVVERLLDTLLVVVVLAVALTQTPQADPNAARLAGLFGVAAVVGFIVLIVFARYPTIPHRILAVIENVLPFVKRFKLVRIVDHVLDGIKPLTEWRSAAHAILWTIISWTFSFITFYALTRALNVPENAVLMSLLSVTLASFSIAIPLSIAAIGPFEGAVIAAGSAVRISEVAAASLGFVFHGITILGYAIWGTIGLVALGVSLGDVMKA
ncbi:MAG: flippase-like domain-containing protein, partial [Anaerolineae bacterium]|nr:flippase-like domain-containing protein [Anaerolineae bacterium]